MLILGPEYPCSWPGRPPGMTREDWPIWMVWREAGLQQDLSYYYNVRLGTPAFTPSDAPDNYRRQWELASLYRIDALGVSPERFNIYEVKQLAIPQDLWQLNTYRSLLSRELPPDITIAAWLIAENTVLGTVAHAQSLDIRIWTLNKEI